MRLRHAMSVCLATIALATGAAQASQPSENVIMILDESGSMWGQIEGKAKIEIARQAIDGLLNDWKNNVNLGVMAYGHRDKGNCNDIELIVPLGAVDSKKVSEKIAALQPKGKTPISASLKQAALALKSTEEKATIILVSDGIETCDDDPCKVAKDLEDAGADFTAHVVGFDMEDEELKQIKCIADNTGGTMLSASNAQQLNDAMGQVREQVVAAAEPAPAPEPEPAKTGGIWFEDSFDGSSLSADWEVINKNEQNYVVDGGKLTVVFASDKSFPDSMELENIFKLTKGVPEGDWTATMRIIPEVQTMRERYHLGIYKDGKNGLIADAGNWVECCGYHAILSLWGRKINNGEPTQFTQKIFKSDKLGGFQSGTESVKTFTGYVEKRAKAIEMRITKTGREYVVSALIESDKGERGDWVPLEKLNSLRLPGDAFVMAFNQVPYTNQNYQVEGGESIVHIDWIRIESK